MWPRIVLPMLMLHLASCDVYSYSPAKDQLQAYSGLGPKYIRYFDANGAGRQHSLLVGGIQAQHGVGALRPELRSMLDDNFRTWCEQRYNDLHREVERLRAANQMPSSDMLQQINSLQSLAGTTMPATSIPLAEGMKQTQHDHLRIWNEERLKVLQAEAELKSLEATKMSDIKVMKSQSIEMATAHGIPQLPVATGDTHELKKARTEHLQQFQDRLQHFEALHRLAANVIEPAAKTNLPSASQLGVAAMPVEDTPEVVRAREEHLRIVQEAKLNAITGTETPASPARSTSQDSAAASIVRTGLDMPFLAEEDQHLAMERLGEAERQREEMHLRETERLAEAERLMLEERMMAEEQVRLHLEDEQRRRIELTEELKNQNGNTQKNSVMGTATSTLKQLNSSLARISHNYQPNPLLVLGQNEQHVALQSNAAYLAPSPAIITNYNPYLLRALGQAEGTELKKIVDSPSSAQTELERATAEHFKAHRIALEELRLANANPGC